MKELIIIISILIFYLIISVVIYFPNKKSNNSCQEFWEIKLSLNDDFSILEEIEKNKKSLLAKIKTNLDKVYYFDKKGNNLKNAKNSYYFRKILGIAENGDLIIQDFYTANSLKEKEPFIIEDSKKIIWNIQDDESVNSKNRILIRYDERGNFVDIGIVDVENSFKLEKKFSIYNYNSKKSNNFGTYEELVGMAGVEYLFYIDLSSENKTRMIFQERPIKKFNIKNNNDPVYQSFEYNSNNKEEILIVNSNNNKLLTGNVKSSDKLIFQNGELTEYSIKLMNIRTKYIHNTQISLESIKKDKNLRKKVEAYRSFIEDWLKMIEEIKKAEFLN